MDERTFGDEEWVRFVGVDATNRAIVLIDRGECPFDSPKVGSLRYVNLS